MTSAENKLVINSLNKEFLEYGNMAILNEIMSEDFINHTAPASLTKDVTGMIQLVSTLHKVCLFL